MNRRVKYIPLGLILIVAIIAAGLVYVTFLDVDETQKETGDLVVNAKAFNGTAWNDIRVQISVGDKTYDTPFRYTVLRFKAHVVQAPSSVDDYTFAEWDNGQESLTRTVSLDFDSGDLAITAYYSLGEHPRVYTFEDGFENGILGWTGSLVINGTSPDISGSIVRTGTSSARFQTSPTLSDASSMIFETISTTDDVCARAYVYVPEGLTSMQMDDRFYLVRIVYGSSENVLAEIGIRRNGTEAPRWVLISAKNSSSTRFPRYGEFVDIPVLSNSWTCVELHWNKTGGVAEAWINGEKQITALATPDAIPSASNVQFGIYKKGDDGVPPSTGEYGITAYFDDVVIDDELIGLGLPQDGFESGDFDGWTEVSTTPGESATVASTMPYSGTYSGMFTGNGTGGWEGAYSYVTIPSASELYARGYFRVSTSGITDNDDSFYFMIFFDDGNPLAYAGWLQVDGMVKWTLLMRDGTEYVRDSSVSSPSLDQWYSVELHWVNDSERGRGELYVNGELVASITGKNTATFGGVERIGFGLPELSNCGPTTVYGDNFIASDQYIGPTP